MTLVWQLRGTGSCDNPVSSTNTNMVDQDYGCWLLMRHIVYIIAPHLTLSVDCLVELSGTVSLCMYLRHRGWLRSVLVRRAGNAQFWRINTI
jgi:hypothetical protein